jgi:hypothetical protein
MFMELEGSQVNMIHAFIVTNQLLTLESVKKGVYRARIKNTLSSNAVE